MNKSSLFLRICQKTETFWNHPAYFAVILLFTAIPVFFDNILAAAVVLCSICLWMLLFCSDLLSSMFPFLMLFLLSTLDYKDLRLFLPCAPLVVLLIVGLAVHIIRWPISLRIGKSAKGLTFVALSAAAGGLGTIPLAEYFSPVSLYYSLGLGLALLAAYLLLSSELEKPRSYDLLYRLMQLLYALGFAMALSIIWFYIQNWAVFSTSWKILFVSFRNFAAAILVSTLPSVFYMTVKNRLHIVSILLWSLVLFLSGSRSALLFGGLILLLGFIYLFHKRVFPVWFFLLLAALSGVLFSVYGDFLGAAFMSGRTGQKALISPHEVRWALLQRGYTDFLQHPIFGIGLGNRQNADLFQPSTGSIVFYHNAIAQVMGSMGLLGIAAYCTLFFQRIRLLLQRKQGCGIIALYYLGMLLVSMTNPGLFCPLPNALLTVLVFTVLEKTTAAPSVPLRKILPRR